MKNVTSHRFTKTTVLIAAFALSMVVIPTAFAQGNLQRRAPQFELMPSSYAPVPAAQVEFGSARVEYNAVVEGIKGIRLHINFITRDPSCPCRVSAYFYDNSDGTPLDGSYPAYSDANGKVDVWKDFTPNINPAEYKDFTLWLPYKALNLEQDSGNEFDLRYQLLVKDSGKTMRVIGKSNFYPLPLKFN
jgi:hypothetical protein